MRSRLKGKVALITGGTSGIGEATVELFVENGAEVLIVGRNAEKGEALSTKLGAQASFYRADVSHEADIEAAIAACDERFGGIDILFNNAGAGSPGELESLTSTQFDEALRLLLGSVLFGMKHVAARMRARGGGAIINNSSVAAFRGHMGGFIYSVAKAGVTQATKLAGLALGPSGITVNSISPGGVATPIFFGGSDRAASMENTHLDATMAKLRSNLARATPLARPGLPRDVAEAALFLASDEGRFVNCHDLVVDAGMTAGGRTAF